MSKRILVLTGSFRKGGNSDMLADAFIKGAHRAGHIVEKISLAGMNIGGCRACNGCWNSQGHCVFRDDMELIEEKLETSDVLVIATPIYWSMAPSHVKAPIDRLYQYDPNHGGIRMGVTESVLLTCGETEDPGDFGLIKSFFNMVADFNGMPARGIIAVPGVNYKGDIAGNKALAEAEALGESI